MVVGDDGVVIKDPLSSRPHVMKSVCSKAKRVAVVLMTSLSPSSSALMR